MHVNCIVHSKVLLRLHGCNCRRRCAKASLQAAVQIGILVTTTLLHICVINNLALCLPVLKDSKLHVTQTYPQLPSWSSLIPCTHISSRVMPCALCLVLETQQAVHVSDAPTIKHVLCLPFFYHSMLCVMQMHLQMPLTATLPVTTSSMHQQTSPGSKQESASSTIVIQLRLMLC